MYEKNLGVTCFKMIIAVRLWNCGWLCFPVSGFYLMWLYCFYNDKDKIISKDKQITNLKKRKLYDTDERNQKWHKQMERYSMFLSRKNQYCENDYTIKCNLQIQCDPYQRSRLHPSEFWSWGKWSLGGKQLDYNAISHGSFGARLRNKSGTLNSETCRRGFHSHDIKGRLYVGN